MPDDMDPDERRRRVEREEQRPPDERTEEGKRLAAHFALSEFRSTGNPLDAMIALSSWPRADPIDPLLFEFMRLTFENIRNLADSVASHARYKSQLESDDAVEFLARQRRTTPEKIREQLTHLVKYHRSAKEAREEVPKALGLGADGAGNSNAFEDRALRMRKRHVGMEMQERLPLWQNPDEGMKRLRHRLAIEEGTSESTIRRWKKDATKGDLL
jgi:hypothetical protein